MKPIYFEPDLEDEENNIYVFGSHQYALYYWIKALKNGKLSPKADLIHIDYHTDFSGSSIKLQPSVLPSEIKQLIEEQKISNDAFIRLALSIGIVENISFCCFAERNQSFGNFNNHDSPIDLVKTLENSQRYAKAKEPESNNNNLILDIDLDYFMESDGQGGLRPMPKEKIRQEVLAINKLLEYATITTIARSPEMYIQQKRDVIETTFLETFDVPMAFKPVNYLPNKTLERGA